MFHCSDYIIESGLSLNSSIYYCTYREYHADSYLRSILDELGNFSFVIPDEFKKLSLSVGDVVSIKHNGQFIAYYVEQVGICHIPDFVVTERQDGQHPEHTDGSSELTEYLIEVEETLQRIIPVKAKSESSALSIVKRLYQNNKIILDGEDLKEVDVRAFYQ